MSTSSRRYSTTWRKDSTGRISIPGTNDASFAFTRGTNAVSYPLSLPSRNIGNIPCVVRNLPSSASSPKNSDLLTASGICPLHTKIPIAIGRSYDGPVFLMSAGASETVIRRNGNSEPEFLIAARTRSRDSCTDESGNPTILKRGTPGDISTSTSTSCPSTP